VFFYAPILLAGVLGWNSLRKRTPSVALVIGGLIAIYLLFYARYDWWYGGGPWGPRFLVVILPLLCIGIAALVDRPLLPLQKLGLAALAALSVGVQLLSILVPYLPYDASMEQDPAQFDRLLWAPAYSPLIDAWHSLLHRTYPPDLAFTYYPSTLLFTAQLSLLLISLILTFCGLRVFLLSRKSADFLPRATRPGPRSLRAHEAATRTRIRALDRIDLDQR